MTDVRREQLIRQLGAEKAVVAIFGVGYVGLLLMLRFSDAGDKAVGVEH